MVSARERHGMKILLVDDEENVVDTLSDFLDDCGYGTVTASDGVDALEVLAGNGDVGLVIADVRMPRMDGITFLKTLKIRYPGVPVILITGHGDEGLAVAALQEGAADYIKKPIKLRELRDSVSKVEDRHALEALIVSGLEREFPSAEGPRDDKLISDLREIHQELEALAQMWEAVRSHIQPTSSSEEEQRIIDFAMDEIPGTVSRLMKRLDHAIKDNDANPSENL